MTNAELSAKLRAYAHDLARHGENLYRVRAVRQAAFAVLSLDQPLNKLSEDSFLQLPGIGPKMARRMWQEVQAAEWGQTATARE
jgi:DNA polymerase/3'-5' exonuclease PolX